MSKEFNQGFWPKDWLIGEVRDKFGNLKAVHYGEDLITSAGKAGVAARILKDTQTTVSGFDYVAIGTGSTAASTGDTALGGQKANAPATGTRVTTTVTNDTAQLVYVFSSGNPAGLNGYSTGTKAIRESGVLSQTTSGVLLCRQTFSDLNVEWDSGDSLSITWKVQVTSS